MQSVAEARAFQGVMQTVRDVYELGERVALGLRQENTGHANEGHAWPHPKGVVTIRAIGAWSEMVRTYAQATGFPKEVYCR